MVRRYDEDKKVYCYICRKTTIFTHRDSHHNTGVESHCRDCSEVWFEWQNRAVQREMEKWVQYNSKRSASKRVVHLEIGD